MSCLVLKNVLKCKGILIISNITSNLQLSFSTSVLNCSKVAKARKVLGQTMILMQDGCDIQELPIIVRRVSDVHGLIENKIIRNEMREDLDRDVIKDTMKCKALEKLTDDFKQFCTLTGIFSLLELIPVDDITPTVAYGALKRIVEIESCPRLNKLQLERESPTKEITRDVLLNRLVDSIINNGDAELLLNTMRVINGDLKNVLCDEVLIRVTDGKMSIDQICSAAKIMASCNSMWCLDAIDKLWAGIAEQESFISDSNIAKLFKILPYFKQSHRIVLNILEKRMAILWSGLSVVSVTDILESMVIAKVSSCKLGSILSCWLSANIRVLTEYNLQVIIYSFNALNYSDNQLEKTFEHYVKQTGVRIKSQLLIATILDYCVKFRLRNVHILNGCSEYFILHHKTIHPDLVHNMFVPYGYLDFQPSNGLKFWQALETTMSDNFTNIDPGDIIDILLSCVYLEKYPLNFVKRVFNPYFLELLNSTRDPDKLRLLRLNLKLFDTAMALECPQYKGPLLPRDHSAKSVWQDGRIKRIINQIHDSISAAAGGPDRYTKSVVITQLPTTELYIVDVMLHPQGLRNTLLNFNLKRDRNVNVAVLIHLPEHYCSNEDYLIGPQVMRKRHLRRLGFKVATLSYSILSKLKVHPRELNMYINERLRRAEVAL